MANRKPQKLINYHSFGPLNQDHTPLTSDVSYGELVVLHNETEPLLGIRVGADASDDGHFAWFIDSAAVVTAINSIEGTAGDLVTKLGVLSSSTVAFSGDVVTKYATKSEVSGHVTTKLSELVFDDDELGLSASKTITALTQTNGQISAAAGDIFIQQSQVSGLTDLATEVGTNSTNITNLTTGLSATVVSDYATKSDVSGHVSTEIGKLDYTAEGMSPSKTLLTLTETDGKIAASFQDIQIAISGVTGLETRLTDDETNIQTNTTNIRTVSGNVVTLSGSVVSMSAAVVTTLGTVYHVKGSVQSVANLPTTDVSVGDVWNVIDASGTPGTADYTPAGTNYVWVAAGNGYDTAHWDPLGGTIDLTDYASSADTYNAITGVNETISTHISGDFANVSGLVNSISATVTNDYATKAELGEAISGLDMSVVTLLPSETLNTIKEADGKVTVTKQDIAIVTSAITDFSTFSTELTAATTNISSLSSATQTIEETANESISAVTTGTVAAADADNSSDLANATASGVKINTDNTTRGVTFDFSELVIDCGDF